MRMKPIKVQLFACGGIFSEAFNALHERNGRGVIIAEVLFDFLDLAGCHGGVKSF